MRTTGSLVAATASNADGTYAFDANLRAGTYKIVEVFDEWSRWLLDGKEMAGSIGGQVDNSRDSNEITAIMVGEPGTTADGNGYTFAEIRPSDISGLVWEDFNNDGEVNFGEKAIPGVAADAYRPRRSRQPGEHTATTDADGVYMFYPLRPSDAAGYTITETQPAGYVDGKDVLGTVNGVPVGSIRATTCLRASSWPCPTRRE